MYVLKNECHAMTLLGILLATFPAEVGVRKALQIAARHRLPLVRVHHMEAHAMVARLPPLVQADGI